MSGARAGKFMVALAAICALLALAVPMAGAAFSSGEAFLPGVPASERAVRYGEFKTLLVNQRQITRITGEGTIDTSFGEGGTLHARNSGVAVLSDGKILLLYPGVPGRSEPTLMRLRADGSPDPTFGVEGSVTVKLGKRYNTATAITLSGGKIVIAGQTGEAIDQRSGAIKGADVIVRLLADGRLDPSFGNGGRLNFGESSPNGYYYSYYGFSIAIGNLTPGPNGQVIAQTEEGNQYLRVTSLGRLDGNFGYRGVAKAPKLPGGAQLQPVLGPVVLPSGNLIVVGTYDAAARGKASRYQVAATRLNGEGQVDRNYGEEGFAEFGATGSLFATGAIEGREEGVLIETVQRNPAGARQIVLGALAVRKGGALDPEFGDGGRLSTGFEGNLQGDGLVRQPSGRALLVGFRSAAKAADEGTVLARVDLVANP